MFARLEYGGALSAGSEGGSVKGQIGGAGAFGVAGRRTIMVRVTIISLHIILTYGSTKSVVLSRRAPMTSRYTSSARPSLSDGFASLSIPTTPSATHLTR